MNIFSPADILLPTVAPQTWATVACDQFTSEPAYWAEVDKTVGSAPSCLRITLPEVYLNQPDVPERIGAINAAMERYVQSGILREYKDALVLVERTMRDGRVRRGVVGKWDLNAYDYTPGTRPPIRPTEGTVLSRIPARVEIRRNAPLELPHVMILVDDPARDLIEGIDAEGLPVLYDFDLMMDGGHLKGYLLTGEKQKAFLDALDVLTAGKELPFAVGDGNHSLATAKACAALSDDPRARYALAELVNIHSAALDFEPIYRVVFGVDPADLIASASAAFTGQTQRKVEYLTASGTGTFYVDGLETKVLQDFIDAYVENHPGASVDYIHGEASLRALAQKDGAVGFLFRGIGKGDLFPYVAANGPLPRKTFSMGEAWDKRYYMEARRIK